MSMSGAQTTGWPVVAGVLLVRSDGRILMQHRDANAPTAPNTWAQPGGHVEAGEAPHDAAARELFEETGVHSDAPLALFKHFVACRESDGWSPHPGDSAILLREAGRIVREISIFYGTTGASEEDLVLGEGDALVFMMPEEALKLPLAWSTSYVLPLFVKSPEYLGLLGSVEASTTRNR